MLAGGSSKNENRSLTPPKPPIAKFAQGKRGFGMTIEMEGILRVRM
jgi:hypothetical protein